MSVECSRGIKLLGSKLHRLNARVPANMPCCDLIGCNASFDRGASRSSRPDATEPGRGACCMCPLSWYQSVRKPADNIEFVSPWRQWLQDWRKTEISTCLRRRPLRHDRTVRDIQETQPRYAAYTLGQCRHHCIEEGQGHGAPGAAQQCSAA